MTAALAESHRTLRDRFLQPLMDHVIATTGFSYYTGRLQEFADRVATRLDALNIDGCQSYLQLLKDQTAGSIELDRLMALLTIGETHFFRHRELFAALESTVLPCLLEKNKARRTLRIWCAGCSIGAEPYSVSMLLRRRFAGALKNWDVRIVGTDINRDFLAIASTARFDEWALRAVSTDERKECFISENKRWAVRPKFTEGVSFAYHNLGSSNFYPPGQHAQHFDLILCRNVMIYFDHDAITRTIKALHACLADGGWLAVGHAENNIEWFRPFRTHTYNGAVFYQKCAAEHTGRDYRRDPGEPLAAETCPAALPTAATAVTWPTRLADLPPCPEVSEPKHFTAAPTIVQEIRELADRGELEQALSRCRMLQSSNPRDPSPHFYHALILQQTCDDVGAEQSLKRAIYLDRDHLLAHYHLGLLLQKQGHAARAARSFQNVLLLSSGKPSGEQVPDADELTITDLVTLATQHLNVLEQRCK